MPLEEEAQCRKCHNMVVRSLAKISGKNKAYWICRVCNTKSVQLSNIFGQWPTKQFKRLSEDQQVEFFDSVAHYKDKKDLKKFSDDYIKTSTDSPTMAQGTWLNSCLLASGKGEDLVQRRSRKIAPRFAITLSSARHMDATSHQDGQERRRSKLEVKI